MIPFLRLPPPIEPPLLTKAEAFQMSSAVIFYLFAGGSITIIASLIFSSI